MTLFHKRFSSKPRNYVFSSKIYQIQIRFFSSICFIFCACHHNTCCCSVLVIDYNTYYYCTTIATTAATTPINTATSCYTVNITTANAVIECKRSHVHSWTWPTPCRAPSFEAQYCIQLQLLRPHRVLVETGFLHLPPSPFQRFFLI